MGMRTLFILSQIFLLSGCSSLGYYAQSIHGHLSLLGRSEAIGQVLSDPATDEKLKSKLQLVQRIRNFASEELQLPANGSYRSYAALNSEAVVWSLVATPEFSMQPKQWCYLIIGCASYRGYFSRSASEVHANRLRSEGLDVTIEPVPAYSTLGWFDDPLPSSVIDWPEYHIAGLIFHELAHQQLYVKGDSAFNEAFANAVEQIGVQQWLEHEGDLERLTEWSRTRRYGEEFIDLLLDAKERLEQLYLQPLELQEMRSRKREEFARLERMYAALVEQWGGYQGFEHWFERALNNARLASVATYEQWLPAFIQLYHDGEDMAVFYKAVKQLAALPKPRRDERLQQLLQQSEVRHPLSES